MINFDLALYSRCEFPEAAAALPTTHQGLFEAIVNDIIAVPMQIRRLGTFLQGPLVFLQSEAEFRVHGWIALPNGHPRFPDADRGLVSVAQAVSREGLYGPAVVEVGWLGKPLPPNAAAPDPSDWVAVMEHEQGYVDIPESSWSRELAGWQVAQLMSLLLQRHLVGMTSRRLLELECGQGEVDVVTYDE